MNPVAINDPEYGKKRGILARRPVLAGICLALLTTCRSPLLSVVVEEVTEAVTPPVVSAVYPVEDSTVVPTNAEISITFSKPIDAATVNSQNLPIIKNDGTLVTGTYTTTDSTVTFRPTGGFTHGMEYTITITANVLDTDGNPLSEEYSWHFTTDLTPDGTAPSITSVSFKPGSVTLIDSEPWVATRTVTVLVNATDDRGIAQILLSTTPTMTDATWVTYNASSGEHEIQLPAADGTHNVYVKAKDGAGNISTAGVSIPIHLDTTAPIVQNLLLNDGSGATNSDIIDISVFAYEPQTAAGLDSYRYRQAAGTWSDWAALTVTGENGQATSGNVQFAMSLGVETTVEAQVRDALGNESAIASASILYEQTPPSIVDLSWDNETLFPYNGTLLRIIFDEPMQPASITTSRFKVAKADTPNTPLDGMINLTTGNGVANAAAELWSLTLSPNTMYRVTLDTAVADAAGNQLGGSERVWFFTTGDAADTTAPSGTVTLTHNPSAEPDPFYVQTLPSGATATKYQTIQLDFSGIYDDYNVPYGLKVWGDNDGTHVDEKSFEQDASWVTWPGDNLVEWHLSSSAGTKYVLYKFMDSAGNESATPNQIKIILDNVLPTISDVTIDGGATHTNAGDAKVDLIISAGDTHSGIKDIKLSTNAAFTGSEWQSWSPTIEGWQLPDFDSNYPLYVKVRDYLDQESMTDSSASIILDRTAPVVSYRVNQVQTNAPRQLLQGTDTEAGDIYSITEAYGIYAYAWSQLSGPGTLYFAGTSGQLSNTAVTWAEPYLSATAEGDYFIKLEVTDDAGNTGSAALPVRWDVTPPANASGLTVSQYDTTGQPTWYWDQASGANFYRTSYSSDFSSPVDVYGTSYSPSSVLADGQHTLYVRAHDLAGNYSAPTNKSVSVDKTAPAITIITGTFVANIATPTQTINFNGVAGVVSDSGTGATGVKTTTWSQYPSGSTLSFGSPGSLQTTVSTSADGTYIVQLRVEDNAGNVSYAYLTFIRDLTAPGTPTASGSTQTPSLRPTWTWTSGGGGTGTYKYRLSTYGAGGTVVQDWTTVSGVTSYQPASNIADVTTFSFEVMEQDQNGNWSNPGTFVTEVNSSWIYPPVIALNDAYPILRTVNTASWNISASAVDHQSSQHRYKVDSETWTTVSNLNSPVTVNRTGLAQGAHTITVEEYYNSIWQSSAAATHTIIVDTIAPTAPALSGTGNTTATAGRTATTDTTPTWNWSSGGGGNGRFRYQLTRMYNANGSADGTVQLAWTAETTNLSYTPTSRTNGTYKFEVQERDEAGNWSTISSQLTTVDTTPPVLSAVQIRGTSIASDTDYTFTRSATVDVVITADISAELNAAFDTPVVINMYDYNPSAWEDYPTPFPEANPASATISTTLTTSNGTKYVYIRLRDEAGNYSTSYNDTIILDTVGPSGTFSINAGAATTPSSTFYMTLSATDTYSSASDISVALLNANTGSWGTYRTFTTSMLSDSTFTPSAGSKTAQVKFQDGAGNESITYSDSITLEVPVPTFAYKGYYSSGSTYIYYNPVTDPAGGSNATTYYIYSSTDSAANPNTNPASVEYEYATTSIEYGYAAIPKGELRYFFVRAYDADTGGYGPYSATSVLGFSSNVTIIYDDDDLTQAQALKTILTDTSIVDGTNIVGTMPVWSVTLLHEDLVPNTYNETTPMATQIYGDPVIIMHGTSFGSTSTYDGRVRNIASMGRGIIGMGLGGAYFISRADINWTTWSLGTVSPTQPSDIDAGNQMQLISVQTAITRPYSTSDSIWFTPLYYSVIYNTYYSGSVTVNIFSTATGRRGVYISGGTNPTNGAIYAADTYSTTHFPVVRQGEYCYFGYYGIPDIATSGKVFVINLVARMDNY